VVQGLNAEESDNPIASSDDVEACPPVPEPNTNNTSHAAPPAFTEFNRDTTFTGSAQPYMAEPNRCSKTENPDDKGTIHHASDIRVACDRLASSCVNCWCNGLEHHSHRLADCRLKPINLCNENWRKWLSTLRLPFGCCSYCGCPQKVFSTLYNHIYGFKFPEVLLR
jgi:hypothetical protein